MAIGSDRPSFTIDKTPAEMSAGNQQSDAKHGHSDSSAYPESWNHAAQEGRSSPPPDISIGLSAFQPVHIGPETSSVGQRTEVQAINAARIAGRSEGWDRALVSRLEESRKVAARSWPSRTAMGPSCLPPAEDPLHLWDGRWCCHRSAPGMTYCWSRIETENEYSGDLIRRNLVHDPRRIELILIRS